MQHKSKAFWEMMEVAAKVCRVERNGGTIKLFPFDRTKKLFVVHEGERAYHPTRRYLKNILGVEV
jgi:hypothetical protein